VLASAPLDAPGATPAAAMGRSATPAAAMGRSVPRARRWLASACDRLAATAALTITLAFQNSRYPHCPLGEVMSAHLSPRASLGRSPMARATV